MLSARTNRRCRRFRQHRMRLPPHGRELDRDIRVSRRTVHDAWFIIDSSFVVVFQFRMVTLE
jgi:hypothetical protein